MPYQQTITLLQPGTVRAECGPMRVVISAAVGKVAQSEMAMKAAEPRGTKRGTPVTPSDDVDEKTIRHAERDGEQLYVRAGLQKKHIRRLRRGQIPIEAEADLHGMRIREAQTLLADFLRECRNEGARCVRVIHGKGLGSRGGHAVLKWEVDRWLRQHDGVMAFCTAQPRDGGTGAVYVLLKG